jgi:hypothetical protein
MKIPLLIRIWMLFCCLLSLSGMRVFATDTQPLATETFWQLGAARLNQPQWTDASLAAEVAAVKRAGMDTIIIHYSAHWNVAEAKYETFVPNAGFPLFSGLSGRHPLRAIFRAAEKENVKVIIGDFLVPTDLRYTQAPKAFEIWTSLQAQEFRRKLIEEFKDSPSFSAYYLANEPNQYRITSEADRKLWLSSTQKVARFIKELKPELKLIHSIGLYAQWHPDANGVLKPAPPSRAYLDAFWRPWLQKIPEIDIWMLIDGIGTAMSTVKHTDMAQQWGKELVHEAGKEYWVDVENAVMNSKGYYAFSMETLADSLRVAAKHADKIVLFEHLNYMSENSSKEASQQLYRDYLRYREKVLTTAKN